MGCLTVLGIALPALQQAAAATVPDSVVEIAKLLIPAGFAYLTARVQRGRVQADEQANGKGQPLPPPTQTTAELRVIALEGELAVARAKIAELERSRGAGD